MRLAEARDGRSRSSAPSSSATGRSPRDEEATRTVDPYSLYLHGRPLVRDRPRPRPRRRAHVPRLDRMRGDVRFATRRERDFRVPPELRPARLPRPRAVAARRERRARPRSSVDARAPPGWSSALSAATARSSIRDDRSLVFTTPYADWRAARALADRPGRPGAARSSPPELVERGRRRRSSASPPPTRATPPPHRGAARARRRAAPRPSAASQPGRARALRGAAGDAGRRAGGLRRRAARTRSSTRPSSQERFKLNDDELEEHLNLLNLVNFGGGCYAVYAERVDGRTHDPRREGAVRRRVPPPGAALAARGQGAAARARPGRPAGGRRRRHDARRRAREGRVGVRALRACASAPTPQPTPLDEDVLSVLSAAVREPRGRARSSTSARQDDDSRASASSSRTTCAACAATGTATPGTARATASARSASTASAPPSCSTRRSSARDRACRPRSRRRARRPPGTASVWFSRRASRAGSRGRCRPDTVRLTDGAALATDLLRLGALAVRPRSALPAATPCCSSPSRCAPGVAARATRARAQRARARHRHAAQR